MSTHPAFSGPLSSSGGIHSLDQTGSLLRMFKSEGFDAHMHISYLFKMKDNQGVQDYLTNELYSMREKDVDFYLPELCLMALSRPKQEKLHAFLLDKAASKMYYAVKIHWMFQSAVEDITKPLLSPVLLENAMKLYQESEMAVVNSRVYSSRVISLRRSDSLSLPNSGPTSPTCRKESAFWDTNVLLDAVRSLSRHVTVEATEQGLFDPSLAMYKDLGDAVPSSTSHWRGGALAAAELATSPKRRNELDAFMLKQLRCDCFNLQNSLVSQLTRLSNNLVACASSADRRKSLNLAMAQLNHWLFDRRLAIAISGEETYMTGLALPLPTVTHEFTHILKVHVDDCKVFRTRQRAPYLVTVEVVDFSDLIQDGSMADLVAAELRRAEVTDQSTSETLVADQDTKILPPQDTVVSILEKIKPVIIAQMLYPPNLIGENRRASIAPGGDEPVMLAPVVVSDDSPVIVVDDSQVTVLPDRKSLKRTALTLRRAIWGELHEERAEALRAQSVYGHLRSWRLEKIIVKGGDDVRQEVLAGQLVAVFGDIFRAARLPLWLRPYEVVVTSANSGLIEMIPNTVSIDGLKKEFAALPSPTGAAYGSKNLNEIFSIVFADHVEEAQLNFIESCAAYCVVSYLLQIKDRHNGNLLLDSDGHLIHIDFGFMLTNAPGGSFALETSPFKLTQEYIDVMGGEYSPHFETFRTLIIRAFLEARKHRDQLVHLVRIVGECNPKLPCFASAGVEATVGQMSDRFCVNLTEEACIEKVVSLIDESLNNWRTTQYDNFQRITNGIWAVSTAIDISKMCSSLANRNIEAPAQFWDNVVDQLLSCGDLSKNQASVVHVLDRIAANGVVPAKLEKLVNSINRSKLSKVDKFLADRALLLLGFPDSVTKSEVNSVQLDSLLSQYGKQFPETSKTLEVNKLSTPDLIAATISTARNSLNSGLTSQLSSCATELIRRIELSMVSPHACVDLISVFSNSIHPLFLQAAYASLLSNNNYTYLTSNELGTVLHASTLAEVENLVLTRQIVLTLVQRTDIDTQRVIQGLAGSTSYIPKEFVHALTSRPLRGANVVPDLLNLLMNGVCMHQVRNVISNAGNLDLIDLASLAMLAAASRGLVCVDSTNNVASSEALPIPESSLEITAKSNPALPRSDVKKARLAKRIVNRGESMLDLPWPSIPLPTECRRQSTKRDKSFLSIYRACLSAMNNGSDEVAIGDIMESIYFLNLNELSVSELRTIQKILNKFELRVGKAKLPMEERRKDEASVAKFLKASCGIPVVTGTLIWNTRIGITTTQITQ